MPPHRCSGKLAAEESLLTQHQPPAQYLLHMAVEGPHSIASKEVAIARFLLTLKLRRVKTYSFFDSF
jgi:hypothetical protein